MLAKAALLDRRTVGKAEIVAWQEILSDVDAADAFDAVAIHYSQTSDWLMPVHIRAIADRLDRDRRRAAREARESEQQRAIEAQSRTDRRAEIAAGIRNLLRERGYPGDPSKLHPRRDYWDRERRAYERQRDAQPNPAFVALPPDGGHPMATVDGA